MTIPKYIIFFILLVTYLQANKIEFSLDSKSVENANVILITANSKQNNNLKAIFNEKEIIFSKHPFKNDSFYALIPFHYFMEEKSHQIIVTYTIEKKEYFEEFIINLIDGKFDKEEIRVSSSKVSLSKKDRKRTSEEYKRAMEIYASVSPENYWYEDFIYPINSSITSNFGTKRIFNNKVKSYHSGIDFKAWLNTKIHASNNGVVKVASNRFYAGNSVVIDHGQGIFTCYYHLNKIFVSVGDFVQRNDIIGLSGNTGRTSGPHLHFAAFVNGIQINPLKLIDLLNNLNN